MAHEVEKDPVFFVSISSKLDAIEHLQCEAQDVKEACKVQLKDVSFCFLFGLSILMVN